MKICSIFQSSSMVSVNFCIWNVEIREEKLNRNISNCVVLKKMDAFFLDTSIMMTFMIIIRPYLSIIEVLYMTQAPIITLRISKHGHKSRTNSLLCWYTAKVNKRRLKRCYIQHHIKVFFYSTNLVNHYTMYICRFWIKYCKIYQFSDTISLDRIGQK